MSTTDQPVCHSLPAKISSILFPPEHELSRLLKDAENLHVSWTTNTSLEHWHGIDCDKERNIKRIHWPGLGLRGVLHWEHLPTHLWYFNIADNNLFGEVPFDCLPATLESLYLYMNQFYGSSLKLSSLPQDLEELSLAANCFEGLVDFDLLPISLRLLHLQHNPKLEGTFDAVEWRDLIYDFRATKISSSNGILRRRSPEFDHIDAFYED